MPAKEVCKVVRLQLNKLYDERNKQAYPYEELTALPQYVAFLDSRIDEKQHTKYR